MRSPHHRGAGFSSQDAGLAPLPLPGEWDICERLSSLLHPDCRELRKKTPRFTGFARRRRG